MASRFFSPLKSQFPAEDFLISKSPLAMGANPPLLDTNMVANEQALAKLLSDDDPTTVLLVKEHVVIVLDLDLSNLLCDSLVILLHLVALRVGESLELLELLVPYRNIRRR